MVQQYELFILKEDEDIETLFSRFQILVYGLHVLNKSYTTSDHVKKIIRNLPVRYKPKVTTIQEAKDLNTLSLDILIRNLQSHGMEVNGDDHLKKSKSLALKSMVERYDDKAVRSSKVWKSE